MRKRSAPDLPHLSGILQKLIVLLTIVVFSFIAASGFFYTCKVEINRETQNMEHVVFAPDNLAVNLIGLAVALCLVFLLLRLNIGRRAIGWLTVGMLASVAALAFLFVRDAHALPVADSARLVEHLRMLAGGDMHAFRKSYYLRTFPFQMGYLFYLELFARTFGSANILSAAYANVAFLVIAYYAAARLARVLFDDPRTELLTVVFLWLFVQPAFLCTFLYGSIPGMALSMLAVLFAARYLRSGKIVFLPFAALFGALAVLVKMNFSIVAAAIAIALVFSALRQRRALPALFAAMLIALSVLLPKAVQAGYESRADVSFGKGTPQGAWLVTGFRESSLAPGWFNSYTTTVLMINGYDQDKTTRQIKEDFEGRLAEFRGRPRYVLSFFSKKVVSQWQEPEFQSVWSSEVGHHDPAPAAWVQNVYTGKAREVLHAYCNQYVQVLYAAFFVGLFRLLKKPDEGALMLPLVLLGAALYHALFEAKAQYVLVYIPLMMPVAAAGLAAVFTRLVRTKKRA